MNLPSETTYNTGTQVPLQNADESQAGSNRAEMRLFSTPTRKQLLLIWFVISFLAVLACSINLSAAKFNGEYVPVGNDSVYHARRILDTAKDPSSFYQFDKKIHAPEGSLLTWPWGYDYALGWMVRLGVKAGISSDPMAVLDWIPVVFVPLTSALLLLVAVRAGLSPWLVTLSGLCMALAPTLQLLNGVGVIDHHFAEMILHLAALAAGMTWMSDRHSKRSAVIVAVILGIAPAVQNGLFILQVPLALVLFCYWLQKAELPRAPVFAFSVTLVATTAAICIPSLPFRLHRFEFYTLSWFHLYIASCTAVAASLLVLLRPTKRGMAVIVLVSALALSPLIREMQLAHTFLAGANQYLEVIGEMQPPFRMVTRSGPDSVAFVYSYFIFLVPITILLCVAMAWRERRSPRLLFWTTAIGGLILLTLQLRMHYFGDFALYMPWFVVANEYVQQRLEARKNVLLMVTLGSLLLYAPAIRQIVRPMPRSNDLSFENIRPMFTSLQRACATDPGIVLADSDAGHYIRYYTECSVLADNFLMTPQHFAKLHEVEELFHSSAASLPSKAPEVKYVLVRPLEIKQNTDASASYRFFFPGKIQLATDLLLTPADQAPAAYVLLDEIRFKEVGDVPYARLYKITHQSGS